MRISAILPHNDYGYWTAVAQQMEEAGAELPVDVKVYLPQLNYNIDQMTELIWQQTAAQVDAVIVQGIDDEGYRDALKQAQARGIQVVLVDTELPGFARDLYVGTDNYAAGVEMGRRLIGATGGSARVAVLSGAPGYPNLEQRLQGLRDAVKEAPDIQILRVEYDQYDAMTVMEKYHQILQESPEIDTLVCIEGTGAQTLGQLAGQERQFSHLLGFDMSAEAREGLESGLIDGLLLQENGLMGRRCVEELDRWRQTGAYSAPAIYTQTRWITAADLEEEEGNEG